MCIPISIHTGYVLVSLKYIFELRKLYKFALSKKVHLQCRVDAVWLRAEIYYLGRIIYVLLSHNFTNNLLHVIHDNVEVKVVPCSQVSIT